MANGPFGNPLSTGIALSFEVDMTPYRQMHARKMAKLEEQKKEKKRKEKELAGILGKITLDEDKIFWRNHDDARIKYADTIDQVSTMYKNGDYSSMYKTLNRFNTDMANLIQSNQDIKARDAQIAKGGVYYDPTIEAMKNNRDVSNEDYARALEEAGYGDISENGIYSYSPLQDMVNIDKLWAEGLKGIEKTVFADGTSKVLGTQDQTRFLETSISDDIYNNKKEQIKQSIRSNPQRAIAFLRANGKDVKSLAGMNPADQALQTDMWLEEIVGGAGEKYKTGEKTVGIQQKKDTSGFVWNANNGRNKNWAWSLAKGGSVNIKDKDADVDKRLNINRVSGGVAENEFTLGTDALIQKVAAGGAQGVFDDAKLPNNTTIKGTPVSILDIKGKKYVQLASSAILTKAEEDRILELSRLVKSGNASPADEQELKELEKLKVKATYLVPYSPSIESQLYNSLGIVGKQVDQMKSYFDGGGASGSATVKTITKAQAQTLMSSGGFSTEAELIADMKNRGISLKITP